MASKRTIAVTIAGTLGDYIATFANTTIGKDGEHKNTILVITVPAGWIASACAAGSYMTVEYLNSKGTAGRSVNNALPATVATTISYEVPRDAMYAPQTVFSFNIYEPISATEDRIIKSAQATVNVDNSFVGGSVTNPFGNDAFHTMLDNYNEHVAGTDDRHDAVDIDYAGHATGATVEAALDNLQTDIDNISMTGSLHDALVTASLVDIEGVDFGVGGNQLYLDGLMDKWENRVLDIIVNVKAYGAVGDGIANDTAAFQEVFSTIGEKTILIPIGEYYIDDTITMTDNTTVIFVGTVLEKVVGKSLFYANAKKNITFINPLITGDGSGTTYVASQETLHFNNCDNIKVQGGFIQDIAGRTAILNYGCRDVWVEGVTIEDYSFAGILCVYGCQRVKILYNKVINCTNITTTYIYPISLSTYDGVQVGYPVANDLIADGNYIDNDSPWWEGIDAHGGTNIKIINNTIKGSYTGIALVSTADFFVSDCLIEGNTCYGEITGTAKNAANHGIVADGLAGSSKNITIRDNFIYDFGVISSSTTDKGGIKFTGWQYFTVENNTIVRCMLHGISTYAGLYDGYIRKNKIIDAFHNGDNVSYGINMKNGDVYKNVYIEDNDILWTTDAAHETITGLRGPTTMTDAANTYMVARNNRISVKTSIETAVKWLLDLNSTASPQAAAVQIGHVGDICVKTDLAAGENREWICTVAGDGTTPGTWVTSGQVGYRTNAGSPSAVLTPLVIGEWVLDTTNKVIYDAVGAANTDWKARS